MNGKITSALVVLLMLLTATAIAVPSDDSDAAAGASPIVITDGEGTEFTFNAPVNKVMTIGKGPTSTAIALGCLDKIIVADKYSATDSDPIFADFKSKVAAGNAFAAGSVYSSGSEQLLKDMAQGVEKGFDKNTDAVIITSSINANILQQIRDLGFKNILRWNSITEYDQLIDYVSAMSKVLLGKEAPAVESMKYTYNYVQTKLLDIETKQDAFYVNYSGNNYVVGNYGSLANSLLMEAGANVITLDASNSNPTYQTAIPALFDTHPDAIVFADNGVFSKTDRMEAVRGMVPEGTAIHGMDPLWNNYSIKSSEGLWSIACTLYPTVFSGNEPAVPDFFKVTDGEGTEFTFYNPVSKIATIGKGPTSTALALGCLDKIVVADKYSATDSDPVFADFKKKVTAGDIFAAGNVYSSGSGQLKTDLAQGVEKGFDPINDAIIITSSINPELLQQIRDMGFKNILRWNSITEYGQLIDYVSVMSKVLLGHENKAVRDMKADYSSIQTKLAGVTEKQDAFYVNYSGGNFVVGNYGSLANSLLMEAGANVITLDASNNHSTYQTAIPALFDSHRDAIVFADNGVFSNAERMNDLKKMLPEGTKVVGMDPLWNNYSIKSAEGLNEIALELYPALFGEEAPETVPDDSPSDDDGNNNGMILVAAIIGVLAIAGVAVFVMKR